MTVLGQKSFAAAHGIERVLDSYADLVTDPSVDVVYNPLANGLHGPWNLAALAAGKHVLTEKPSASNAEEAAAVRDAVAGSGTVFMEGFHYLFHPVTRRLHELLASGDLGELRHVETVVNIPAPAPTDARWSLRLAGGALMDVGTYALHAQRMLAPWAGGPPQLVAARAAERPGAPGVDEWLDADLSFPSGATGTARCHMAFDEVLMTCHIVGSQGEATAANFVLPHLDDRITVRDAAGERVETAGHPADVRLSAGGVRCGGARWRPVADRPGRRSRDHGADRRLLSRGRAAAPPAMGGCRVAQ